MSVRRYLLTASTEQQANVIFVVFLLFWVLLLIITEKNERDV